MNNPHNFTDNEWLTLCNRINSFGYKSRSLRRLGKVRYVLWRINHPEVKEPFWMKPTVPE
jgi:hypothetical protein